MSGIKKKCVVVTYFDETQPGFLDFSYRIQSLAEHYQLTIVSTFGLTQPELLVADARYVVLNVGHGRKAWIKYLLNSAKLIRQMSPDVVVLLHSMVAPVAMLIKPIPNLVYWNEHPTHVAPSPDYFSPVKSVLRWCLRSMMFYGARCSNLVMPIGEDHRDDLLAHRCDPSRMHMMYMGVADSFYQVANSTLKQITDAPLNLLYVGTVHEERGRDVMLKALALVNQQKMIAHLTIVGASDEQSKICHKRLVDLNAQDFVTILGRVSGDMIPSYMANADAGLCLWADRPWYRFNPPTKLFEYLVAGLPVLASDIRTHKRYIKDGLTGMIFNYDAQRLSECITRFWLARADLPRMREAVLVESPTYLWSKIAPEFIQKVNQIAHRQP